MNLPTRDVCFKASESELLSDIVTGCGDQNSERRVGLESLLVEYQVIGFRGRDRTFIGIANLVYFRFYGCSQRRELDRTMTVVELTLKGR